MAYATVFHVEAINSARGEFTANTHPSATQCVMFLDQCSGKMDSAMLKGGYAVPVDLTVAASSVKAELENINAVGAAYMVEASAQVGPKRDEFQNMWQSALKMLEEGNLPGLAQDSNTSLPRFDAGYPTAMFHRDMDL